MAVYELSVAEMHPNRPDVCRVFVDPHPVTRAKRQIGVLHRDTSNFLMLNASPVVVAGEEHPIDTSLGPGHEKTIRALVAEWIEENPWNP